MMRRLHITAFALICMTLVHYGQAGVCSISPYASNLINSPTDFGLYFAPTSISGQVPNKITFVIPAYFGIKWAVAPTLCTKDGGPIGQFIGDIPTCVVTTDAAGIVTMTITNLPGSTQTSYRINVPGFTMGPAEKSNNINAAIGQTTAINCYSYDATGAGIETVMMSSGQFPQLSQTSSCGVTLTSSPSMNSQLATFSVNIVLTQPIPATGSIVLRLPKNNVDYTGLGPISPVSYIQDGTITATGTVTTAGVLSPLGTITSTIVTNNPFDAVTMLLTNAAIIPSASVINLSIDRFLLTGSLKTQNNFEVSTADKYGINGYVQKCATVSITNQYPGDDTVAPFPSSCTNTGQKGVLEGNNVYKFNVFTISAIPSGGFFTLYIPTALGLPADPTTMAFICLLGCKNLGTRSWSAAARTLTFNSVYPTVNDYLYGQSQISFTLGPFTNAATSVQQFFIWKSYASLGTSQVQIDQIKTMSVTAEQGLCKITKFFPTDNNVYVYGVAISWTFTLSCVHDINTDYGLILTFPALFTIRDTSRCTVGLQNTSYICQANSIDKTITISRFTNTVIPGSTVFSFSVDSIVNPPWTSMTDPVNVAVSSGTQGAIDLGSISLPPDYFIRGYIKKFTVVPEDLGVGSFPVKYSFTIQPTGEVWKLSYFEITIPDEVEISDEHELERKCNYNVQGFQWISNQINCKVINNKITVYSAFRFQNTTNMTDNNNALVPPVFSFSLPAFRNPRTMMPTGAFGLTVYDQFGKPEYTWNMQNWTYSYTNNGQPFSNKTGQFQGPVIQMSKASTAKAVLLIPGSFVNGNITYYEFLVTTTNYLQEGDNILITLPDTMFFSENSTCVGRSTNIRVQQVCKPSVDLSTMNITLQLPVTSFRMLQAVSTKKIAPLESFQFRITQMKNPISTQPTTSLGYYVYTKNGTLFEMMTSNLNVTMKTPGTLNFMSSSILPNDFRQSYAANYTLSFSPMNFQQNMKVVVTLPPEILFGSNKVKCWGAAGTDSVTLNCTTDTVKKTVTINDAFAYQVGNPGTVKFIFATLKNPTLNAVTGSFKVQTYTSTGYPLDQVLKGLEVNFFCQYPCSSCNLLRPDQCYSCYGANSPFTYFFDYKCFDLCPVGYVNTTTNNCTTCLKPCSSCAGTPSNCTNCTKGFQLLDEGVCRELVYWPFPFFAAGFIFFIIILAAEIKTKTESRFKEAFIAFLALPEIGSWATLIAFLYLRIGLDVSTYLAALALLIFIIINLVHACVHPRQIVPNSLFSYQQLVVEHKCNTWTVYLISYIFSFKFSLILVSYFWLRPPFKGDYSAVNWMTFNKIGLSFICIPYPIMMAACCYFLVTDGMFSYPGFICIEVIVLSSVMTVLMLLDAVSVLKCRVVGKDRTNNQIKVASGLDYESDDDNQMKKVLKRRNYREGEDFGADEIKSDDASQTGLIRYRTPGFQDSRQDSRSHTSQADEETRKQIAMLEELARQMREEKEYLRLEKERIERERMRMLSDKDEQLQKMQNYMNDFSITEAKEPRHVTIREPIREPEQKSKSNRKNYRDIEGEMEDYEQIEEEEEASEIEVVTETVQLPLLPVFGQINYIRHADGDDHFYLQQLSPRAGHQSFVGEHEGFTDEIHMNKNMTAHYDEGIMRKTVRHQEDYVFRDDASYSQINMTRQKDQSEIYQQRSDAEMDQHSNRTPMGSAQQFFQNEQAVFSNEDVRSEPNDREDFINREEAQFGRIDDIKSRQGSERQYFVPEEPAKGQGTGRRTHVDGEVEKFVNRDEAAFDQILTPNNRQGTPQQYFNKEKPSLGQATDRNRSQHDTQQAFINQERVSQGDIDDTMNHDGDEIRHFNQDNAFREVASDHSRVRMGTHQDQLNQQEPQFDRDSEDRQRIGTQEKQFNATQAQFDRDSQIRSRLDSKGQIAVMQASAEFGKTDGFGQSRLGESQNFINKSGIKSMGGGVTGFGSRNDSQAYLTKSDALYGREEGLVMREGAQQNFMPEPIDRQDLSGKSESSEGIVDHNPFNSVKDRGKQLVAPTKSPVKKVEQKKVDVPQKNLDMPTAQVIPNKKKKTIIYSDKSESSVEEMMGDTPSNYNIPNGRLDGKSLGLKAILLQAQKHGGTTIDYKGSTEMAAQKNQTKSPQATSNQQNMLSKPKNLTEAEERKFVSKISKGAIDKSVDGGWGSINQNIGANRVQVIGEEQSENEYTSGPAQTKRKKVVKTNKTFAEPGLPRPGAKNVTPPPNNADTKNLANVRKNNFV